jgi:adenosine kinase
VFDPGQNIPTISKKDLLWCAQNAKYFIVNQAEYQLFKTITQLNEPQAHKIADMVIITQGNKGSTIYHQDTVLDVPIAEPTAIVDPTGAGDAYRAGFFTGILNDLPLEICAKMGSLAGAYCVEAAGAQNPDYTYTEFRKRFEKNWDDFLP